MSWIPALLRFPDACLAWGDRLADRGAHAQAFGWFSRGARAGHRVSQHRLGRCYLLGLGVPPSLQDALRWLTAAAKDGVTQAQTQLAELALQGVGGTGHLGLFGGDAAGVPDYDRAAYWAGLASDAGSAEAQALLAYVLTAGPAGLRDQDRGHALYRQSALAGCARGQLGLAMILMERGEEGDTQHAAGLLKSAAEAGIAVARHMLGMLAEADAGDLAGAAQHYKVAAELGYAPAQLRYAYALLHGRGVAVDAFTAETWLRRAALAGQVAAAAVLGFLFVKAGDNPAEAAMWLERAAEAGHASAARTLGQMHLMGRNRPGDAVRWFRQAAEAGDAAAAYQLGLCLAHGIGCGRDQAAAVAWLGRAAGDGDPDARRLLADLAAAVSPREPALIQTVS